MMNGHRKMQSKHTHTSIRLLSQPHIAVKSAPSSRLDAASLCDRRGTDARRRRLARRWCPSPPEALLGGDGLLGADMSACRDDIDLRADLRALADDDDALVAAPRPYRCFTACSSGYSRRLLRRFRRQAELSAFS